MSLKNVTPPKKLHKMAETMIKAHLTVRGEPNDKKNSVLCLPVFTNAGLNIPWGGGYYP